MTRARILLIEDDPTLLAFLGEVCRGMGMVVSEAARGDEALARLGSESFDIVLSDLKLPGVDGIQVLKRVKEQSPHTQVILMTAFATVDLAVEAMKAGACEFLQKPFTTELVEATLGSARQRLELQHEIAALSRNIDQPPIIGLETGLRAVGELIDKVAASDANVVIYGESGVGKEMVAREIHKRSARAARRLVALHIAAIPDTLVEAELFGHARGAFTGAVTQRVGLLELADGGTLFLDEIGDLSEFIQVKLLRFLQERSFRRLGGNEEIEVDVRVISATHRNLADEVAAGRFREDLYYRLNVVPIAIPPLRERKQDIPALVEHFLARGRTRGRRVSPGVLAAYQAYDWPGNVRELENVVARAAALSSGDVLDQPYLDLPAPPTAEPAPALAEGAYSLTDHLADVEKRAIMLALEEAQGVKTRAAQKLGIKRTTLLEKMSKYGIR